MKIKRNSKPEMKNINKNEERAFQLELMKIQQGMDVCGSVIGLIASVFVAIITTSITLIVSLPSTYASISATIIGYEVIASLFTLLVSWWIIVFFRNRRLKLIVKHFGIPVIK